jgi:hypothetical protein
LKSNTASSSPYAGSNLVGIASYEKDYRLSWYLNKALDINLKVSRHKFRIHLKGDPAEISFYCYEDSNYEYYLFSNFINNIRLLPKYKNINFWLLMRPKTYQAKYEEIETRLNECKVVITSFTLTDMAEIHKLCSNLFGE